MEPSRLHSSSFSRSLDRNSFLDLTERAMIPNEDPHGFPALRDAFPRIHFNGNSLRSFTSLFQFSYAEKSPCSWVVSRVVSHFQGWPILMPINPAVSDVVVSVFGSHVNLDADEVAHWQLGI
jgi:hypothetical protein